MGNYTIENGQLVLRDKQVLIKNLIKRDKKDDYWTIISENQNNRLKITLKLLTFK